MASPSETISLCKILSESRSIIRSHLHHFQALTVLFVFPLYLSLIFYPTIQTTFFSQSQYNSTHLLFTLLYSIFVNLLSLCAVATISYSTYRAFYEEPVNLIESIKSIFNSFSPLFSTIIVLDLIASLILIPFLVLVLFSYKWLHSTYFLILVMFISFVCVVLLTYLQVNWILAYVVAVVESKWGYKALQRSAHLIKGNRGVALSMLFYNVFISGVFFWCLSAFDLCSWAFFFYAVFCSFCLSFVVLGNFAAIVVLYVYCRDLHEGLPLGYTKICPLLK